MLKAAISVVIRCAAASHLLQFCVIIGHGSTSQRHTAAPRMIPVTHRPHPSGWPGLAHLDVNAIKLS